MLCAPACLPTMVDRIVQIVSIGQRARYIRMATTRRAQSPKHNPRATQPHAASRRLNNPTFGERVNTTLTISKGTLPAKIP